MRRYTISIDGSDHEVDVEEVTANTFRVQIAGKSVDVRLRDHQDLAQAMITPEVEVGRGVVATAAPSALPHQAAPQPAIGTPGPGASPHPAAPAGGGAASGVNTLTAPMPGVVLSISAQPGQSVKRGDALLVLEAMKMKNELRASRDGIIASIPAEVGAQVKFGDELVVFE